jgi:hypothetical protein
MPIYPWGAQWIGGWVDPRDSLDVQKRKFLTIPGLELRPLGRPARTQSLYRLHYPGYPDASADSASSYTYDYIELSHKFQEKDSDQKNKC